MTRSSAISPYSPMYLRTVSQVLALTGRRAASVEASKDPPRCGLLSELGGRPKGPPPRFLIPRRFSALAGRSASGLDRLAEHEFAVLDVVDAVVGERRVAVLVDVVGSERRLAALRLEQRVDERLLVGAVLGQLLAGVEDQAHRLVAVDGVRVNVLDPVLRLVLLEELLSVRRVLLRCQRGHADLDLRGDVGWDAAFLRVVELGVRDPVRPIE